MTRARLIRGMVAVLGAAGAGALAAHLHEHRRRVVVTVYSEPGYRGERCVLAFDNNAYSLNAVGLSSVGSIRVQRAEQSYRPALMYIELLMYQVPQLASREREYRAAAREQLARFPFWLVDPDIWRREIDPGRFRQSWIRLWVARPYPPTSLYDARTEVEGQLWCDVLDDTPDLGPWRSTTRYLEPRMFTPDDFGGHALDPAEGQPGYGLPLKVVD